MSFCLICPHVQIYSFFLLLRSAVAFAILAGREKVADTNGTDTHYLCFVLWLSRESRVWRACTLDCEMFTLNSNSYFNYCAATHHHAMRCVYICCCNSVSLSVCLSVTLAFCVRRPEQIDLFMPPAPKAFGVGGIMFSGVSVCERVCESVVPPTTLWAPYLKNQLREFHPSLVTNVIGFTDVLIRIWGPQGWRSRSHQTMTRKPSEYNIFITIGANFTKIMSHMYMGQETHWFGLWVKRSKVKVTCSRRRCNRLRQFV